MTESCTNNLRVLDIVSGTIVDGPGLRTSIYFAGCAHHCPQCHNPQSWNFNGGSCMTIAQIMDIVKENDFDVTLSGGDPLYQLKDIIPLCQAIRAIGKNIWCYTGFTYEQICRDPSLQSILSHIDVLVDGPYIDGLKDTELLFRGSSNQRLIDVRNSSPENIVVWQN